MARSPYEGLTPEQLIDDLGVAVAARYREIEAQITARLRALGEDAHRALPEAAARRRIVTELRRWTQKIVSELDPELIAETAMRIVRNESSAEIARQLLKIPSINANKTPISANALYAVAASEIELRDSLRALNARIYRAPADAYQRMTAAFQADRLIGRKTWEQVQRSQVERYIADGITGFTDRGGRRWAIGNYAEMATRTASARAYRDQSVASMAESGIRTFSPAIGADACELCAPWAGKVLTDGSRVGKVTVPHAITGEPTEFVIDATLDEARAAGWGHPNCRDVLVPALPGYKRDETTFDSRLSRARVEQRKLETEIRHAKRDGDVETVRRAQADLRALTEEHGIRRRSFREQVRFTDGGEPLPRSEAPRRDAPKRARAHAGDKRAQERATPAKRSNEPAKPTDDLPRLDRPDTYAEATYSANPGAVRVQYGEPSKAFYTYPKPFQNNCHIVVNAMEFRARGFDVVARPTVYKAGRTAETHAADWYDPKTGVSRMPFTADSRTRNGLKWIHSHTDSMPNGSRGVISGQWKTGNGHVYSWEKVDGKIVFYDGQTINASMNAETNLARMRPSTLTLLQMDDLEPLPSAVALVQPNSGIAPVATASAQRYYANERRAVARERHKELLNPDSKLWGQFDGTTKWTLIHHYDHEVKLIEKNLKLMEAEQ